MKRLVVLAVACLTVALVASGTAGARSTALTPAEKNLQRQLNAVTKDVTALQEAGQDDDEGRHGSRQVSRRRGSCWTSARPSSPPTRCRATWTVIDQIATATQAGKTYFGRADADRRQGPVLRRLRRHPLARRCRRRSRRTRRSSSLVARLRAADEARRALASRTHRAEGGATRPLVRYRGARRRRAGRRRRRRPGRRPRRSA